MLLKCPECGGKLSSTALSCPRCGQIPPEAAAQRAASDHQNLRSPVGPPTAYTPGSFVSLFMWWAILCAFVVVTMVAAPAVAVFNSDPDTGHINGRGFLWALVIALVGLCFALASAIPFWILVYRSWAQIRDGHARTSPGRAVGLCFIPVFNFYWVFVAILGLASDANAYCARHGIDAPRIPPGLALSWCVLFVVIFIPYVGIFTCLISVPLMFALVLKIANTSAAIAEANAGRRGSMEHAHPG